MNPNDNLSKKDQQRSNPGSAGAQAGPHRDNLPAGGDSAQQQQNRSQNYPQQQQSQRAGSPSRSSSQGGQLPEDNADEAGESPQRRDSSQNRPGQIQQKKKDSGQGNEGGF